MRGEPVAFVSFPGSFGRITWYTAEVTSFATYTALFEPLAFLGSAETCDNEAVH